MKANRTVSLDTEIIERLLREPNYSSLINDLLIDYYRTGGEHSKKELIAATDALNKDIIEKNNQLISLQTELNNMRAKELETRNKKPICPACNSESTIKWKGKLVCMKCHYEEEYKED